MDSSKMNLNFQAPLNLTSYGYVSTYLFRELLRKEVDLKYFPIGQVQVEPRFVDELKDHMNFDAIVHPLSTCLKIWHQHDLAGMVGNGSHVGFTIFELNKFTDRELSHLRACDHLIVCSEWARQVLRDAGITDAFHSVVPLGFDPEIFVPSESKRVRDGGPFVFANFGKWEIRKGHDVLVEAFNNTFSVEDDVELWMFPHNFHIEQHMRQSWENYYLNSKLGSKIKIFPRLATQSDLYQYMKDIDCGVFPSRAEGWNLEALECLACGKEVIATNYAGHTEFMNTSNSHLIDLQGKETAFDGVFFNGQGQWAKWDKDSLEQLTEKMKEVYHKGKTMDQSVHDSVKHLTWENSCERLLEVLRRYD